MLDAGYWILDAGCWIVDAGWWMNGQPRPEGAGLLIVNRKLINRKFLFHCFH
jgi:hypothetical protein